MKHSVPKLICAWRQLNIPMMTGMMLLVVLVCAACSRADEGDLQIVGAKAPLYRTQINVPTPNYRDLFRQPVLAAEGPTYRPATAAVPVDAKALGELWIARLQGRRALLGSGVVGKGPNGPVVSIDTGLTESEFDEWTSENRWSAPGHIRWSFAAPMNLPSVSKGAAHAIRIWPATVSRTGLANSALLRGHVELRDGCLFAGEYGLPANKLAMLHAEIGLDVDPDGYLIFRNRVSGQTLARLGEEIVWSGPATAAIGSDAVAALKKACGDADILPIGSPESRSRFLVRHARS